MKKLLSIPLLLGIPFLIIADWIISRGRDVPISFHQVAKDIYQEWKALGDG